MKKTTEDMRSDIREKYTTVYASIDGLRNYIRDVYGISEIDIMENTEDNVGFFAVIQALTITENTILKITKNLRD